MPRSARSPDNSALHLALREAMDLRGVGCAELAAHCGVSTETVERWRKPSNGRIRETQYLRAAAYLQSGPMGTALLELYGVPCSRQTVRKLRDRYKLAAASYRAAFEEDGWPLE
jgi:hypothetical protein